MSQLEANLGKKDEEVEALHQRIKDLKSRKKELNE